MSNGLMPEQMLQNLLAVIHRDGGHYTAQHGLSKSYEDAIQLSSERIAALDGVGVLCTPDYCVANLGPKEST